jgi:Xaa-Pro aminopeptidase
VGSNKTALQANFIVSNEPGYYADGEFGIRIENLVSVVERETPNNFDGVTYFGFEPLTYVPMDMRLLAPHLMSAREVAWLDDYHRRVWDKISPRMADGSPEKKWLWEKTQPLVVPTSSAHAVVAEVGQSS